MSQLLASDFENSVRLGEGDILTCQTAKTYHSFMWVMAWLMLATVLLGVGLVARDRFDIDFIFAAIFFIVSTLSFHLTLLNLIRHALIIKITSEGLEVTDTSIRTRYASGRLKQTKYYAWSDIITWRIASETPKLRSSRFGGEQTMGLVVTACKGAQFETFKIGGDGSLLNGKPVNPARFLSLVYPHLPDNSVQYAENTHSLQERATREAKKLAYSIYTMISLLFVAMVLLAFRVDYWMAALLAFLIVQVAVLLSRNSWRWEYKMAVEKWEKNPENLEAIKNIIHGHAPLRVDEMLVLENFYNKLSSCATRSRIPEVFNRLFTDLLELKQGSSNHQVESQELEEHLQRRYRNLVLGYR